MFLTWDTKCRRHISCTMLIVTNCSYMTLSFANITYSNFKVELTAIATSGVGTCHSSGSVSAVVPGVIDHYSSDIVHCVHFYDCCRVLGDIPAALAHCRHPYVLCFSQCQISRKPGPFTVDLLLPQVVVPRNLSAVLFLENVVMSCWLLLLWWFAERNCNNVPAWLYPRLSWGHIVRWCLPPPGKPSRSWSMIDWSDRPMVLPRLTMSSTKPSMRCRDTMKERLDVP